MNNVGRLGLSQEEIENCFVSGRAPIGYNINESGVNIFVTVINAPTGVSTAKPKTLVIFEDGDDGYIIARCPAVPECITQGKTKEEAMANIREILPFLVQERQSEGLPLFDPIEEVEVDI